MNKFSYLVFALVIAAAAAGVIKHYSDAEKASLKSAHDKCQADDATKIDESFIKKFRAGEQLDDPQVKVYFLCLSKLTKFINENGDLNTDYIKSKWAEHFNGEDLTKLHECLVQKDTPEETAYALSECSFKVLKASLYSRHHHK